MGVLLRASGGRAGEWKMRRSGAVQGDETCEAMAQAV
jgi:hypothetical protein